MRRDGAMGYQQWLGNNGNLAAASQGEHNDHGNADDGCNFDELFTDDSNEETCDGLTLDELQQLDLRYRSNIGVATRDP